LELTKSERSLLIRALETHGASLIRLAGSRKLAGEHHKDIRESMRQEVQEADALITNLHFATTIDL
jgi:hypothetical protein